MLFRIAAVLVFFAFVIAISVPVEADAVSSRKNKAQMNQLVSMLPDSDMVITIHSSRMLGEALPMILGGNGSVLAEAMSKIESIKQKVGVDVHQFEYAAVGLGIKEAGNNSYRFEPAVIARGSFDPAAVIASAKTASNGKYREERFDGKAVYIFNIKDLKNKTADSIGSSGKWYSSLFDGMSDEVAVAVMSPNTIAVGTADRVRETVEANSRVATEIIELLNKREVAVMNIAGRVPNGLSKFLPLDDDELGRSIDSIKFMYGGMDIAGNSATISLSARTEKNADAQLLSDTLIGLKTLGVGLLGGSKRADQQLYARLINNVTFTRSGSVLTLEIKIPRSDLNALTAELIK